MHHLSVFSFVCKRRVMQDLIVPRFEDVGGRPSPEMKAVPTLWWTMPPDTAFLTENAVTFGACHAFYEVFVQHAKEASILVWCARRK